MFILKPVIHETIWGGSKLHKYTGGCGKKIGHLYLVNGHSGMSNKVMNGKYSGKTLREVFHLQKSEWKMDEYEEFPLTIALVDASDNLSIQVHPDDVLAGKLEGKKAGKTESWLFLEKPDSGWIYDGCTCATKEQVELAVKDNRLEEAVGKLGVGDGDYVCIAAGTLHAMTAGSLVYEIEYGSDYTYRFYDYDRKDGQGNSRELHIEKAVEAVKTEIVPAVRRNIGNRWISEEKYEIREIRNREEYKNNSNKLECFTLIDGRGILENFEIHGGMGILLLPGEKIENVKIDRAVVAKVRNQAEEKWKGK